jgi:hypothetical protein
MLQKKAKTLSLIPVNDSRMDHFEERGNDTIRAMKKQSDSDYDVKCTTIKFHGNNHHLIVTGPHISELVSLSVGCATT